MSLHANPIRADLANVAPVFYPIVGQGRFGSLQAMCKRHGWPLELVETYVQSARVECSDFVVMDRITLGDPALNMRAVLMMRPGGAVMLCAGLFDLASPDEAAVRADCAALAADPDMKGRFIGIGQFRANERRAAS